MLVYKIVLFIKMVSISSVLPALTCDGVGNGWTAYGYKAAAEVIFASAVWNIAQLFYEWISSGVTRAELLLESAMKTYEEVCATSAKTAYASWYRVASRTINKQCLDAAQFKAKAIYNINQALIEVKEYIIGLIWKANATVAMPVVISGLADVAGGKGSFEKTYNIASFILNSRHVIVCKIAAGLELAFQSSSSCSRKRRRVDKPELKL